MIARLLSVQETVLDSSFELVDTEVWARHKFCCAVGFMSLAKFACSERRVLDAILSAGVAGEGSAVVRGRGFH